MTLNRANLTLFIRQERGWASAIIISRSREITHTLSSYASSNQGQHTVVEHVSVVQIELGQTSFSHPENNDEVSINMGM